ncbi:MAG TPA: insulinase family protein, partial [Bacteroidota bacterium]|nr:insulinase family protein [Bacteroidota bacterium]
TTPFVPVPPLPAHQGVDISEERVQLPRLFITWPGAPRGTREDALLDVLTTILSAGKNSRLYRPLVFERQVAQSVASYTEGKEIAGTVTVDVTGRPGASLAEIGGMVFAAIDRLCDKGVTPEEIEAACNGKEAQIAGRLTTALGIAHGLATNFTLTGDAGNFNREIDRFQGITPDEIAAASRALFAGPSYALSIVPQGERALAFRGDRAP